MLGCVRKSAAGVAGLLLSLGCRVEAAPVVAPVPAKPPVAIRTTQDFCRQTTAQLPNVTMAL
ncbi:MAG: hypothetical protein V4532_16365, partial [Pseudomonadota bacterium]